MRILLASDSFDPATGGVQRVVADLADTLSEHGHAVHVLAPRGPGEASSDVVRGIDVTRLRLGRPALRPRAVAGFARRYPAASRSVRTLLHAFRPDVVHLHFLQSPLAYVLPAACAVARVPMVATAHGRDVVGDMVEQDAFGAGVVRRVLNTASVVTAPSAATLSDARALVRGRERARFEVVPNALPADMQAQLGQPASSTAEGLVGVGELHPKKGFDVLLRALSELPGVPLRIAGSGAQEAELRALAASLGIDDRVEFAGFVGRAQLPAFIRGARVQVVPSRREPFGLVLLEGMACSVPVVASRVDGIPDVVDDAAVLVPPGDATALRDALRELLADQGRCADLVRRGRERAALHTRERTVEAYAAVYASVIGD